MSAMTANREDSPSSATRREPLGRLRPRRRRSRGRVALWLLGILGLVVVLGSLTNLLPSLHNPFATTTVDRSPPPVLRAIEDLSVYKAATGNFQVVVDQEKDTKYVPSVVSGERTLFLAVGTVDAEVDFTTITNEAIQVSPDQKSVTITLPHASLGKAVIDTQQSRVVTRNRGLLDRLGGVFSGSPTSDRGLYLAAEQKLVEAAAASGLVERAEQNTRVMLTGMMHSLGFTDVTVVFVAPTPAS